MRPKPVLAGAFRTIARATSVILVPSIVIYLLFVGLQGISGEPAFSGLFLYMLLLILMAGGLVIAWRREALGATVALGAGLAFFLISWSISGIRATLGFSPLVGPLMLLAALIKPQSFDPVPNWIIVASWALFITPIGLYFASWLLRTKSSLPE